MQETFEMSPAFYFFYEGDGVENAFAIPAVEDEDYPGRTVALGLNLIAWEYPQSLGGTTIPIIIAHEFGHITDIRAAARTFYFLGDANFGSPNHHGTPRERANALMAGFAAARSAHLNGTPLTLEDAIHEAKDYLGLD